MSDTNTNKLKTVKLNGLLDRRRRLTDEDKEHIKQLHKENIGVREIARMYESKCSRRSIQFVLFPERLEHLKKMNREGEHWKKYHDREKLTTAIRNWRRYKTDLYNKVNDIKIIKRKHA